MIPGKEYYCKVRLFKLKEAKITSTRAIYSW
jgi:hypothetical protein